MRLTFLNFRSKAAENEGNLPTAPELFLKTHFKNVPGKGKIPANRKAKEIAVFYFFVI